MKKVLSWFKPFFLFAQEILAIADDIHRNPPHCEYVFVINISWFVWHFCSMIFSHSMTYFQIFFPTIIFPLLIHTGYTAIVYFHDDPKSFDYNVTSMVLWIYLPSNTIFSQTGRFALKIICQIATSNISKKKLATSLPSLFGSTPMLSQ